LALLIFIQPSKKESDMSDHDYERIVPDFNHLNAAAKDALAGYVEGAQILEIVTARAHGVIETGITYLRDARVHDVVYDETTGKILGGTEESVIQQVLSVLPESGRQEVLSGNRKIRKIKIKHDDKDDREYIHVHFIDASGNITSPKLELDGRPKS